jgi:hypothetical protein
MVEQIFFKSGGFTKLGFCHIFVLVIIHMMWTLFVCLFVFFPFSVQFHAYDYVKEPQIQQLAQTLNSTHFMPNVNHLIFLSAGKVASIKKCVFC